jgi:putative FmdB family regulatory protein
MPIYEYKCQSCEQLIEVMQRMSEAPLTTCENCGGELKKQVSAPAFQFKGTGWYVTDYTDKGKEKKESGKSDANDGEKSSGEGDSGKSSSKDSSSESSSSKDSSSKDSSSKDSKSTSSAPQKTGGKDKSNS